MNPAPFRIRLWDTSGTERGRGVLLAEIEDAKDIGASEYVNAPGECFFTLPQTHPAIGDILPLRRHIEISRYSALSGTYVPFWCGLLDDYEADRDEVVCYGADYLAQVDLRILGTTTSYANQAYSSIIWFQLNGAIETGTYRPLGWMGMGTVETTAESVTIAGPFAQNLVWLRGLTDILRAETSTRPVISVTPRSNPANLQFYKNQGGDVDLTLEYGGNVSAFKFRPNYRGLYTYVGGIGQKRDGASILYSTQTYADASVYGLRQKPQVFLDVTDQTALDRRVKRAARRAGTPDNGIAIGIRSGALAPWDGYDMGDSITLRVSRGIVNLNARYTVWGQEWIGHGNGREELFLDLSPKET